MWLPKAMKNTFWNVKAENETPSEYKIVGRNRANQKEEKNTRNPTQKKEGLIEIWVFFCSHLIFHTFYICSLFIRCTVSFNYILVTLHFRLLFYKIILFVNQMAFLVPFLVSFGFSTGKMLAIFCVLCCCVCRLKHTELWILKFSFLWFYFFWLFKRNGFHFRHQFAISLFCISPFLARRCWLSCIYENILTEGNKTWNISETMSPQNDNKTSTSSCMKQRRRKKNIHTVQLHM